VKHLWLGAGLLVVGGSLALWASNAWAEGIPSDPTFYYSGVLEEGGEPVDGVSRDVEVAFFDAESGGDLLCREEASRVPFEAGRFRVPLGEDCTDGVRDSTDVWVRVRIGTDAAFPRTRLGAVPYAVEAERAQLASDATRTGPLASRLSDIESRVSELESTSVGSSMPLRMETALIQNGGDVAEPVWSSGEWLSSVRRDAEGVVRVEIRDTVFEDGTVACSTTFFGGGSRVRSCKLNSGPPFGGLVLQVDCAVDSSTGDELLDVPFHLTCTGRPR